MNNIWKIAKLDFYVTKTYTKSIIFTMIYPVIIGIMNQSIVGGISLVMCFIGMMTGYVFSISEKNDMDKLYSILPVPKKHIVIGRYLYTCIFGLSALLLSLIVQSMILQTFGIAVRSTDIFTAVLTGIITFSFYPVFLLPGYYKYGYLRGRYFILIPLAGYLSFIFLASETDISALYLIFSDPIVLVITVLLICIIAFLLSVTASIQILKNKEI